MKSRWRKRALGDLLEVVIDYRGKTPRKMGGDWSDEGYRVLSAKHVKDGEIVKEEEIRRVSQDVYERWMQIEVEPGDIILTSEAPFGEALYWDRDEKVVLGQRLFGLRPNPKLVDGRFLYYAIADYHFQQQLAARATGTTVRGLRQAELLKCTVPVPERPIQKAIAYTLSCIDKMIKINNQVCRNLESQAETMFKNWFIDFEPFKDGEFIDSPLGLIPKGWKVEKLEELVNIKYGKDHRSLPDGDIPVYGSGGLIRYISEAIYTSESVLIPRKGTLNNVMLVNHPFWSVDTMFYTEINKPNFAKFLFQLLKRKDLASMNVGSAVPSMTVALLNQIRFVLPPDEILEQFERVTNPFYLKIENNRRQNQILAALRDTLLPKLMSGEIEVPVVY
jgi:type I restriction enzyme S subunit